MSLHDHRQPAPNFTDAFLCTVGLLLFMALCTIAAIAGYFWVAITTWALNHSIGWIGRKRT